MTAVLSHATAVRQAILSAKQLNQRWLDAEQNTAATPVTTTGAPASHPCSGSTHMQHTSGMNGAYIHTPTKAVYTDVSDQDVLLGLRIGTKLIIIDAQKNKYSDIVQAVDGLLQKAKKLADADGSKTISVSTSIDGNSRVLLEATPTRKGLETKLFYIDGVRKQEIAPIGQVNWYLG